MRVRRRLWSCSTKLPRSQLTLAARPVNTMRLPKVVRNVKRGVPSLSTSMWAFLALCISLCTRDSSCITPASSHAAIVINSCDTLMRSLPRSEYRQVRKLHTWPKMCLERSKLRLTDESLDPDDLGQSVSSMPLLLNIFTSAHSLAESALRKSAAFACCVPMRSAWANAV